MFSLNNQLSLLIKHKTCSKFNLTTCGILWMQYHVKRLTSSFYTTAITIASSSKNIFVHHNCDVASGMPLYLYQQQTTLTMYNPSIETVD